MTDYVRARRRKRLSVIVAGTTLLAMIIAVSVAATLNLSGSKSKPASKTAYGVVSIPNHSYFVTDTTTSADGCHGTGDYTDLAGGGTVTISDNVGTIIATTHLAPGKIDVNGFCEFNFSAPKVPTNRGPYGVQITRRKIVEVNESDLFSLITLTLGNT
jgi:hypothetical protein